jgi:hypothetical protein
LDLRADELETLREIGTAWLEAKADRFEHAIKEGILQEASYNDGKQETWPAGRAMLETAKDMRNTGVLDEAAYTKVTMRHPGVKDSTKYMAAVCEIRD